MHILTNMVLQVYNNFPTYPTTQTKANQPEIRTGRTTKILIALMGGVALTRADFPSTSLHHHRPEVSLVKTCIYPELRQNPLWIIGLLFFVPIVFVLPQPGGTLHMLPMWQYLTLR